jgi:hypothetical protein
MTDIKKAIKFVNSAALTKEIEEREKLLKEMVGTLYPGIVLDEIIKLRKRRKDIINGLQ